MLVQQIIKEKNQRQHWKVCASELARKTRNPIREIVENLHFEPNPEKNFIALSIGDPTVFGNLNPDPEIIQAIETSLSALKYNGYAPSAGYNEAREAVAKYTSENNGIDVDPQDVILCSGCSGALDICLTSLACRGQNILIPRPGFAIYNTISEGLGIEVRYYDLQPTKNWEVDLVDLQSKIDVQTAAIVVINPSNPCGSVYSEEHLRDILQLASQNFVPIIADEIYEHIVFPGSKFTSLAALSEDVPILSCSGLAKRFLVPGWRLGWIIVHDRNEVFQDEIRRGLQSMSQRIMGANTLVQGALKTILENTPNTFHENLIEVLHNNASLAYNIMKNTPGLMPIMPEGAMYMMVGVDFKCFPNAENGLEFVQQLVEEQSVFCLPGECFHFPGYMRLVLTLPIELLKEACERISEYAMKHYKEEKALN